MIAKKRIIARLVYSGNLALRTEAIIDMLLFLIPTVAALLLIWLWAIAPQVRNRPNFAELRKYDYAHRGLHNREKGLPENSLKAIRLAAESGFGIEFDVQLTKDDQVVVFHDPNLRRICGENRRVRELSLAQLKQYRLLNTEEQIPTLHEALQAVGRRTPILVEIKGYTPAEKICPIVWDVLSEYRGAYCIQSFDPLIVKWFKENQPHVVRGQLMEKLKKGQNGLSATSAFLARSLFTNFLTRPNFEAYEFKSRSNLSMQTAKRLFGMQEASWTLRNPEDYAIAKQEGNLCIFEGFEPYHDLKTAEGKTRQSIEKKGMSGAPAPANCRMESQDNTLLPP